MIKNNARRIFKRKNGIEGQEEASQKEKDMLSQENENLRDGNKRLMEEINFLKYRIKTLDDLHESIVQKQWPHDGSMQKYGCVYPFVRLEILPRGEVYTCCSAYLKHNYYIGNIYKDDFSNIWNSDRARNLRKSVLEGNFEYCMRLCKWLHSIRSDTNCANCKEGGADELYNPVVRRDLLTGRYAKEMQTGYAMTASPKNIVLSCDESCNLSCPTCRSRVYGLSKQESDLLYERLEQVVKPLLRDCIELSLLTSGEVFASRAVSKFLKGVTHADYPSLELRVVSNLQLLNEKKWQEFSNLKDIPMRLMVSIDGASKKTYEINRRGGKWETLIENLNMIKRMRQFHECKIERLYLNMVVQENNYDEIGELVKLAEKVGADFVNLQKLTNWGTFSEEEYNRRNVCDPKHKCYVLLLRRLREAFNLSNSIQFEQNIVEDKQLDSEINVLTEKYASKLPLNFPAEYNGLLEGWHAQDGDQGFRFVKRYSRALLRREARQREIHIRGFIPENITEVHKLSIYVDDILANVVGLNSGDEFNVTVNLDYMQENVFELKLEFDSTHEPNLDEADQRVISGCVLEIF